MSPDPELGDYLLGELDPAARAAFEARLASDPALRAEVERLAPAVARLEALPEPVWDAVGDGLTPPAPVTMPVAGTSARPARADGAGRRDDGRSGGGSGRRRRLPALPARTWGVAALAAVALLGAGVGIGVLLGDSGSGSSGAPVATGPAIALAPLGSAPTSASANARMTGPNRMLLTIEDLPPAPAGTYYEAWLLNDPDDLVPVASFAVGADGRAVVEVPLPAAADQYRFIDVSLQRVDGGTQHSSNSVLRGSLS